jgi:hypothetical protein
MAEDHSDVHIRVLESRVRNLEEQLRQARAITAEQLKQAEAEEEFITNSLMKKLSSLQQEKQHLASEIAREEDSMQSMSAQLTVCPALFLAIFLIS